MKISFTITNVAGFTYNTIDGADGYSDSTTAGVSIKVCGTLFIGFKLKAGAALIDEDLAAFEVAGTFGLQITGTLSSTISTELNRSNNNYHTITGNENIICCASLNNNNVNSIHACGTCIDGDVTQVCSLSLEIKATKYLKITIPLVSIPVEVSRV